MRLLILVGGATVTLLAWLTHSVVSAAQPVGTAASTAPTIRDGFSSSAPRADSSAPARAWTYRRRPRLVEPAPPADPETLGDEGNQRSDEVELVVRDRHGKPIRASVAIYMPSDTDILDSPAVVHAYPNDAGRLVLPLSPGQERRLLVNVGPTIIADLLTNDLGSGELLDLTTDAEVVECQLFTAEGMPRSIHSYSVMEWAADGVGTGHGGGGRMQAISFVWPESPSSPRIEVSLAGDDGVAAELTLTSPAQPCELVAERAEG